MPHVLKKGGSHAGSFTSHLNWVSLSTSSSHSGPAVLNSMREASSDTYHNGSDIWFCVEKAIASFIAHRPTVNRWFDGLNTPRLDSFLWFNSLYSLKMSEGFPSCDVKTEKTSSLTILFITLYQSGTKHSTSLKLPELWLVQQTTWLKNKKERLCFDSYCLINFISQ